MISGANVKKGQNLARVARSEIFSELIIFMRGVATNIQAWLIEMWRVNEKCIVLFCSSNWPV